MSACTKFHAHGLGNRGLDVKYLYFAEFQEKWSEILRVKVYNIPLSMLEHK